MDKYIIFIYCSEYDEPFNIKSLRSDICFFNIINIDINYC